MPADATAPHRDPPTGPPSTLPPTDPPTLALVSPADTPGFELHAPIGVGGMGVVHRARDLTLRRDVAVKVLKDTYAPAGAAARRFVAEAEITAQLQHPGIPPVYHVGRRPDGRPFLAMKLVKGETLADLLKANPDRGRLVAVFEGVCQAVAYAHAHGVIHRDLKPANVMVGAFGEVQVMDWGLAKVLTDREAEATDPEATAAQTEVRSLREDSDHTQDGQALGTPAFMPPEQAVGDVAAMDRRSDVFGLGAVLCVVLTGSPPFVGDTAASTRALAARAKLDDAFAKLEDCGAEPGLVALCKRCLSAEKADRPADAGEVAEAVAGLRQAADDRARAAEVERGRSEVRRRLQLRLGGLAAGMLLAGLAGTFWQAWRAWQAEGAAVSEAANARAARNDADAKRELAEVAERERSVEAEKARRAEATALGEGRRAIAEAANAKASFRFLTDNFLAATRPAGVQGGQGWDVKVSDTLTKAEADIPRVFAGRPMAEAEIRQAVGVTWMYLAQSDRAETNMRRAMELRAIHNGSDHPDTLTSVHHLAELLANAKYDLAAAESLHHRALVGREKVLGTEHPDTLTSVDRLAGVRFAMGDFAAAELLHHRALAGREAILGPDHPDTLDSVNRMAGLLRSKGDIERVEPLYRRVLAGREKVLGPNHPDTLDSISNMAVVHRVKGDLMVAELLYRRALAGKEKVVGLDHPDTLLCVDELAGLLFSQGDLIAAEPLHRRAAEGAEQRQFKFSLAADFVGNYARCLQALGHYAEAEGWQRKCIAVVIDRDGLGSYGTTACQVKLGLILRQQNKWADAESAFRDALTTMEKRASESKPIMAAWEMANTRSLLGEALLGQGRLNDAGPLLRSGYYGVATDDSVIRPEVKDKLAPAVERLIRLARVQGKPDDLARWLKERASYPPEVAPKPRPVRTAP